MSLSFLSAIWLLLLPAALAAPTDAEMAAVESTLLETITLNPDDAGAWFDLASVRLLRKDFLGARAAFELTLEADPNHAEAMNSLGNTLLALNDVEGAVVWFQRSLEADPTDPKAPFNLGELAYRAHEFEAALTFYGIAHSLDETARKPAMRLAEVHLAMGNPSAVHEPLRPALRAAPNDVPMLILDGQGYHRAEQYAQALKPFLRARELEPDNLIVQRWVGTSCGMAGQWECAEVAYGDALALAPDRADLWLERGQARAQLGPEYAGRAVADFERAAELDPESPRPRYELGVLMERAGRDSEALSAYRAALGRDATHCPSALNAGRLQIQAGQYAEAETTLDKCLRSNPDYEHAQLNRGLARARAGLCELAADDLQPIADGGGPGAEHAANLMAECGR